MRGTHSGVWVHVSVCPCLCLCPVRVRQGDMASRLAHSGSENVASGAGEVRALWGLSFAPCKMGITIAACPRRLLRSSNETVDLNSKEPFELSSVSGCAHGCVGVRASERLCRELPATPFSCRDKSAVSSVPSHQKYTCFWPRAMLSNSPGGGGWGAEEEACKVGPYTSGQGWPSRLSPSDRHHARGQRPPLPPPSDWGLSGMRLCPPCRTGHSWGPETIFLSLCFSLRKTGRLSLSVAVAHSV